MLMMIMNLPMMESMYSLKSDILRVLCLGVVPSDVRQRVVFNVVYSWIF